MNSIFQTLKNSICNNKENESHITQIGCSLIITFQENKAKIMKEAESKRDSIFVK